MIRRILLLMPTTSYRAAAFLEAAERAAVEVVVGTERRQALADAAPGGVLALPFSRPRAAVRAIVAAATGRPFDAVLGTDDETTVLAAEAARALGLPHNDPAAVRASRDKYEMRRRFAAAGLAGPAFERVALDTPVERLARRVRYPCVLKPLALSGSRGVIRADDAAELARACATIRRILRGPEARRRGDATSLLVEDYLPGDELAVEGLLQRGELRVLAIFDKPDPLVGPTFEETLLVTPSRMPPAVLDAVTREVAAACRALGLSEGPVHAELRVHERRPRMLEVAARSIGGLCSRALRFGAGVSLEELLLRQATGASVDDWTREPRASGVMMIPIPCAGVLRGWSGLEAARAVPGVREVTLSARRGARLVPLPEGHRYLGFVFATAETPGEVEHALRAAHARLSFEVEVL